MLSGGGALPGAQLGAPTMQDDMVTAVLSNFPEFKSDVLKEDKDYFRTLYTKRWHRTREHFVGVIEEGDLQKLENSLVVKITALQEEHLQHIKVAYYILYSRIEQNQTKACPWEDAIPSFSDLQEKAVIVAAVSNFKVQLDAPMSIGGPGTRCRDQAPEVKDIKADLIGWNTPTFTRSCNKLELFDLPLMISISNTATPVALRLIEAGVDVNKYSVQYFNNPLLLATAKGWNHIETDIPEKMHTQEEIIRALLRRRDINVNAVHMMNGMTALHFACFRCDDPTFIEMLLAKGANKDSLDLLGRSPFDYLEKFTYAHVQTYLPRFVGSNLGGLGFGERGRPSNQAYTATIPTEAEYNRNKDILKNILAPSVHYSSSPAAVDQDHGLLGKTQQNSLHSRRSAASQEEKKTTAANCILPIGVTISTSSIAGAIAYFKVGITGTFLLGVMCTTAAISLIILLICIKCRPQCGFFNSRGLNMNPISDAAPAAIIPSPSL